MEAFFTKSVATLFSVAALLFSPCGIFAEPADTTASKNSEPTYILSLNRPGEGTAQQNRPKVGLVLAGGGAKGAAHIGVLKVMEEVGIPVDYVTGTSMGSIIGALYSLGYSPAEMDTLISGMDWSMYMSDKAPRRAQSYEDKMNGSTYLLSIPFNTPKSFTKHVKDISDANKEGREARRKLQSEDGNKLISTLPGGFISGNNLLNLFNSLCVGYQDSMNFNDLPIPFACVATDVITGKQEIIRSGKVPVAIRASMAIPGVFAPVKTGGKVLVDGGMLNNFPTDVCKRMGADIIIGVEVNNGNKSTADDINSLPELLSKMLDNITSGSLLQNRMLCDIHVHPDLTGYGTLSFDKESIDTIIQRGYTAADAQREYFQDLKKKLDSYGKPVAKELHAPKAGNLAKDSISISSINMEGIHLKDGQWLLKKTKLREGDRVSGKEIEAASSQFFGTKAFSSINYYLREDPLAPGKYIIDFKFKPAEPHIFGFGFRFDSEETAAILLKLSLNEQKLRGLKIKGEGRLSYNPWAQATLTLTPLNFAQFSVAYRYDKSEANYYDNGKQYSNMRYHGHEVRAFLSETYSRFINADIGVKYEGYRFNHIFTSTDVKETPDSLRSDVASLYAKFNFDNLDKAYFATRGLQFSLTSDYSFYDFRDKEVNSFGDIQLNFQSYIPMCKDNFVIIPQAYSRFRYGHERPMAYENMMGGSYAGRYFSQQLPFVGVNHPEFLFDNALILRSDFRVNIAGKHYLTGIVNYCRESDEFSQFLSAKPDDPVNLGYNWWGVALEYAFESMIGPISLNVHWSNITYTTGLYFNLGFYF